MKEKIAALLKNQTIRNGALFSVFSFFTKGVTFVLLMILAKYIDPTQYGLFSLFNTVLTFLGFAVGLSTAGYLGISYFRNKLATFKVDLFSILLISVVGSLFFCIVIFVLNKWLSSVLKLDDVLLIVAVYVSFSTIIYGLLLDFFRVKEKVIGYGLVSCGYAVFNFFLTFYFIKYCQTGWVGFVYSQTICNTLFAVYAILYFLAHKLIAFNYDWSRIKSIILWGLPLIPHSASNWIKQGLDRYIIDYNYALSDVGIFSFALNLANIIIIVGIAFNQSNSVSIFKALSSSEIERSRVVESLKKKEKEFLIIYASVALFVITIVGTLIPYWFPKYEASLGLFLILALFGLGHCYYLVYCNYLLYFNKNLKLMYITFGGSVAHLLLSLWLTRYSLYYTCIIYVLSQGAISLLVYCKSRKLLSEYEHETCL